MRTELFEEYLPSLADGEEGRLLIEAAMNSAGPAVEEWRKEEGFREAGARGVPGTIGVWPAVEVLAVAPAGASCPPTLNVDVEAVAWWVGCK